MFDPAFTTYPLFTVHQAIASHVRWKITLQLAITLREPLSDRAAHSIRHAEECAIRQWLISPNLLHLRAKPAYRVALERHAEFHREMQCIADRIEVRDFDGAGRLLHCSKFQEASNAMANAIMALQPANAPTRAPASAR